jgi:hypothetical protein
MPRKAGKAKTTKTQVKVSYQKAGRTPSARPKAMPLNMGIPKGSSPLTRYIEENRATGIPVTELIQQFQEYDCEHPAQEQQVMAAGVNYKFVRCSVCHRVEKKVN